MQDFCLCNSQTVRRTKTLHGFRGAIRLGGQYITVDRLWWALLRSCHIGCISENSFLSSLFSKDFLCRLRSVNCGGEPGIKSHLKNHFDYFFLSRTNIEGWLDVRAK